MSKRTSGIKHCKWPGCASGKPAEYRDMTQHDFSKKYLCTSCGSAALKEGFLVCTGRQWTKAKKEHGGVINAARATVVKKVLDDLQDADPAVLQKAKDLRAAMEPAAEGAAAPMVVEEPAGEPPAAKEQPAAAPAKAPAAKEPATAVKAPAAKEQPAAEEALAAKEPVAAAEQPTVDKSKPADGPQEPMISFKVAKENKLALYDEFDDYKILDLAQPTILGRMNAHLMEKDTPVRKDYSLIAGFVISSIKDRSQGAVHKSWAQAFRWLLFQISRPRPEMQEGEDYDARCEWLCKDFKENVYDEPIRGSLSKSLKTRLKPLCGRIWTWAWEIFRGQYWGTVDEQNVEGKKVYFTNQAFVEQLHWRAWRADHIVLAHPGGRFTPYIGPDGQLPVAHIKMSDECQTLLPGTNTGHVVWEKVIPDSDEVIPGSERHYYFICKEQVDEASREPSLKKLKKHGGMATSESTIGDGCTTLLLQEARVLTGGHQIPVTAEFTQVNRRKLHNVLGGLDGMTFDLALNESRFQTTEVYTPLYHCLSAYLKKGELRPIHERSNDLFNEHRVCYVIGALDGGKPTVHGTYKDENGNWCDFVRRERDFIEFEQHPLPARPQQAEVCINPLKLYYASEDPTVINLYDKYEARYPLDEDIARREREGSAKQHLANMCRRRDEPRPPPFTLDREKERIYPSHEDLFQPVRNPTIADDSAGAGCCDVPLWSDNVKGVLPGTPRGSTHADQYKLLEERYKYHLGRVGRLLQEHFGSFIKASKEQGFDKPTAVALLSEEMAMQAAVGKVTITGQQVTYDYARKGDEPVKKGDGPPIDPEPGDLKVFRGQDKEASSSLPAGLKLARYNFRITGKRNLYLPPTGLPPAAGYRGDHTMTSPLILSLGKTLGSAGKSYDTLPGWLICLDEELEGADAIFEGMYLPPEFGDKESPTCSVCYCFGDCEKPQTIIIDQVATTTDVNQIVKSTDTKLLNEIADGKHGGINLQEFRGHAIVYGQTNVDKTNHYLRSGDKMESWRQAVQRGPAAGPNDPAAGPNNPAHSRCVMTSAWARTEQERVRRSMLEAERKGTPTHSGGR